MERYLRQHVAEIAALPTYRPTIGCIIFAYNEAETIEAVLRSLLKQTRLPDEMHVVVNNTTDDTFERAAKFVGSRTGKRRHRGEPRQHTEIYLPDIGEKPDKKVGALNDGFAQVSGADYLLGVG